jgi:hypothetical protein
MLWAHPILEGLPTTGRFKRVNGTQRVDFFNSTNCGHQDLKLGERLRTKRLQPNELLSICFTSFQMWVSYRLVLIALKIFLLDMVR